MAEGVFISLRVTGDVLARVDAAVSAAGSDRSTWIRNLILKELGDAPLPPRPRIPGKSTTRPTATRNAAEPTGPCLHPHGSRKRTAVMTVCTECGTRL